MGFIKKYTDYKYRERLGNWWGVIAWAHLERACEPSYFGFEAIDKWMALHAELEATEVVKEIEAFYVARSVMQISLLELIETTQRNIDPMEEEDVAFAFAMKEWTSRAELNQRRITETLLVANTAFGNIVDVTQFEHNEVLQSRIHSIVKAGWEQLVQVTFKTPMS